MKSSYEHKTGRVKSWQQSVQAMCLCWGGCSLGNQSAWCRCCSDHLNDHQLLREPKGVTPLGPGTHIGTLALTGLPLTFCTPSFSQLHASKPVMRTWCLGLRQRVIPPKTPEGRLIRLNPPSDFQDMSHNPLLHVNYKDLVPITRLFQMQLPISRRDQRHLANFIQGWDIPWGLHPEHENFKPAEGGASTKYYNCLAEGCNMQFMNKESHTRLFCPWTGLDGCHLWSNPFQNWEAFQIHLNSIHGVGLDTSYGQEHSGV